MSTSTEDVKKKALEVGFVSVGVSNPERLQGLPHGWVSTICNLRSPNEVFPNVKSVILMGFNAWDRAFNLAVESADSFYYEILKNKAWSIVDYLRKKGFESALSLAIPLKVAAVRCGLGCQGKNTLLITPDYGPRVRLVSVLTTAELNVDEPFEENLCGDCEKCIRACPTKALEPYRLKINRCITYAAEKPKAADVSEEIRNIERRLIERPTPNSFIQCTRCIEVCPVGVSKRHANL